MLTATREHHANWLRYPLRTLVGAMLCVALVGATPIAELGGQRRPASNAQYVALGSSFAAGPGVGKRARESPVMCLRSDRNYAQLLAAMRHLDLVDVTCSGATALNLLEGGPHFQGPQIDALSASTELVTLTVGGNDVSYIGNLIA